jgi:uncharacterized protein (UPF0261 family)
MATVLLVSSVDTREKEILFLKGLIESQGCKVLVMDVSMGAYKEGAADYSCLEVAREAGIPFREIAESKDTNKNMEHILRGATIIAKNLYEKGLIDGIAGFGGVSNTTVISLLMKELPFGFPKLILTTAAAIPAYAARLFAETDIAMLHSCVDVNCLNKFVISLLNRFAGMVAGAVSMEKVNLSSQTVAIALTEFKFSEKCTERVRILLEQKGFEIVPFSATGTSDRIMEQMASNGLFGGIIDVVPAGLSEALLGGNRSAGTDRLDKELQTGIPVILTPCGFDMLSCGPYDRKDTDPFWKKKRLARRKLFVPDKFRVQARTTRREIEMVAQVFADKLNNAKSRVIVFIPLLGFSSLSKPGGPLFEPQTDKAFVRTFKKYVKEDRVEIVELNNTIDDPEFADAIVERFMAEIHPSSA